MNLEHYERMGKLKIQTKRGGGDRKQYFVEYDRFEMIYSHMTHNK